jgi:hypothetical protein
MFVDEFASQVPQLERMGSDSSVPESHKAPMLLAWIPVKPPLESTAAALRAKDMSELTWVSVSTILIDEQTAFKARSGGGAALSESGGRHGCRNRNNSKRHGTKTSAANIGSDDDKRRF